MALAIFATAIRTLFNFLEQYRWRDIREAFTNLPLNSVLLGIAFTIMSFGVLTLYDVLALRYAGRPLPYRQSMLVSIFACALGNSVSPGFISGGAIRYRMFSAYGLNGFEIAKVITFCSMMTGMGVALFGALGLSISPGLVASADYVPSALVRPVGLLLFAPAIALIAASLMHRKVWRFWRKELQLPSPAFAFGQVILPLFDDALAGAVLFVLLPSGSLSFAEFAGVYSAAVGLGFISYVPGGLGVFESLFLVFTASRIPGDQALAALMGYRVIYYFAPLGLGALGLGIYELTVYRKRNAAALRAD